MRRRRGELQHFILAYMLQKWEPVSAKQLAEIVHPLSLHGTDTPPPTLIASVRRAIHALEKRGLLQCGGGNYQDGDSRRLYCWVPEDKRPHPHEKWMHIESVTILDATQDENLLIYPPNSTPQELLHKK